MAADCKSADGCLRRFESYPLHHSIKIFPILWVSEHPSRDVSGDVSGRAAAYPM